MKGYYKDEDKNDFEILIAYDNSDFEKLVEIVNDFQEKGLRVRTENIENLKENDSEIFNYDEKYLLSFVVRRDGSSRLTRAIRWGTFPSASIGWRLDKEKFFPISKDVVNLLKLRASYGVLGNENIGEYQYMATMAQPLLIRI